MTVKLSQERKVRSLAKKTLGSTRVGSAMRLPAGRLLERERARGVEAGTRGGLEERLGRHGGGNWLVAAAVVCGGDAGAIDERNGAIGCCAVQAGS